MCLEELILKEFYRTELRDGEDVIDNRDSKIAEVLGLDTVKVSNVISNHLDNKWEVLNKRDFAKGIDTNINSYTIDVLTNENKTLKTKVKNQAKKIKELETKLRKLDNIENKIKDACIMFENGYRTSEVITALKYKDRSMFYKHFKKIKNKTVKQFKKQINKHGTF